MISDDLRRQADEFVDLSTLASRIGREPSERMARPVGDTPTRHRGPNLENRYGIRQPEPEGE
jgi:hypothetical protein